MVEKVGAMRRPSLRRCPYFPAQSSLFAVIYIYQVYIYQVYTNRLYILYQLLSGRGLAVVSVNRKEWIYTTAAVYVYTYLVAVPVRLHFDIRSELSFRTVAAVVLLIILTVVVTLERRSWSFNPTAVVRFTLFAKKERITC